VEEWYIQGTNGITVTRTKRTITMVVQGGVMRLTSLLPDSDQYRSQFADIEIKGIMSKLHKVRAEER
jgi:hypothetical protein